MWLRSAVPNPSRVVSHRLGHFKCYCLVAQERLLDKVEANLQLELDAASSSRGICQEVQWEDQRWPSKDLWKLSLKMAVWMREKQWLVCWLCWVRGCDWWDFTSSALASGEDTDATFGNLLLREEQIPPLVGYKGPLFVTDPHQSGLETRSFYSRGVGRSCAGHRLT